MEDQKFTSEEAQRIVEVSMRLQAQWQESVSLAELERTAMECGIETRFVHQAIQLVQQAPPPPSPKQAAKTRVTGFQIFLGLLATVYAFGLFAYVIWLTKANYQPDDFGSLVPFLGIAAFFGAVAAGKRRPHLMFVPLALTGVITILGLIYASKFSPNYVRVDVIFGQTAMYVVLQLIALGLGFAAAKVWEKVVSRPEASFSAR